MERHERYMAAEVARFPVHQRFAPAAALVCEKVPGYMLPAPSAMTPSHSEAFELLGVKPHAAPSLARAGETDPMPASAVT